MLDIVPDVVLLEVLKRLDRDAIRNCRDVNKRLRRTIDSRRTQYPMHPAYVRIHPECTERRIFVVAVTSEWTNKQVERSFRIISTSMESDRGGNYWGLRRAFFEEEPAEPIDVSFGVALFREVLTGLLENFDITGLNMAGAIKQMLVGVSQATRRSWQEIPFVHIFPIEEFEPKIATDAVEFCAPTQLELYNFSGDEIKLLLTTPVVQNVKCLEIRLQNDWVDEEFAPEIFLGVKCERLEIFMDEPVPMTTMVMNGILKQWCNGERTFVEEEAWNLWTDLVFSTDVLMIFEGVPTEMIRVVNEFNDVELCFLVTRSASETVAVQIENVDGVAKFVINPRVPGKREERGEAEGETEGEAEGETEGEAEGETEGEAEGETEGEAEGETECEAEGETEGEAEGETEGETEGEAEGETEGEAEGETEGEAEGETEGEAEGEAEGETEGEAEGETEGEAEGETEGEAEGETEGEAEGETEGEAEGETESETEGEAEGETD